MAVQKAVTDRSFLLCSSVKPTNTGTVPKGFIIENKAPNTTKNNSIVFCANSVILSSLKVTKGLTNLD